MLFNYVQFLVVLQLSVVHGFGAGSSLPACIFSSKFARHCYISSLQKMTEEPGGGSPACPFFAEG